MRFADKTAIVTGGSEGIGFAVAEGLAAGGARVVLVARRESVLAAAVAKLGLLASYVVGDVADDDTAARAVSHAAEAGGGLDLLVGNAGVLIPGHLSRQPPAEVDRMLAVNLRGSVAFMREATPLLAQRPGAAAVMVSSATGRQPVPGAAIYGATKAALNYLVATWARELAPMGIRVNGVCPGAVDTPQLYAVAKVIPGLKERNIATNLIKRIAAPEEIARPVLRLLDSAESGYVTGSIWDVDGGYRAGEEQAGG
jgi:NAD(P)-dependent dehydrogenase (short-subunit alcohol dehydrogenase family)